LQSYGKTTFDDILIDVGTADGFWKNGQLLPEVSLFSGQVMLPMNNI
jgi:hypothetical protein